MIDIENLNSVDLIDLLGKTVSEVRKRHNNGGDTAILKSGRVIPRFCPDCGSKITVFCVEVNWSEDELRVLGPCWKEVVKDKKMIPPGWMFANVPCRQGRWFTVYCDCHARDDWFESQNSALNFYLSTFHGLDLPVLISPRYVNNVVDP